ncbi:MAG: SRPBCC domain-containing protein [Cyclobacteriaceae bacterium]
MQPSDKIIEIAALLNCSAEIAFSYFSENELLEKWLTAKADVVMEPDGKFELFWTPDDPDLTNNSTYGCNVLAVDKPNYFNIEWMGNAEQKSFMNTERPLTNVTVIFSREGSTWTKVTLIHTGWRPGKNWEGARLYFVKAWSGAFKELEKLVNGK